MLTKPSSGIVIIFAVIGHGTGSFQTVTYDVCKPERENYFSMSITLNTDSVSPKVSLVPSFMC